MSKPLREDWQTVGIFGATRDLAGALAQFRALPRTGRTWAAVRARPLPVAFFVRGLLGSLRTPASFASAAAAGGIFGSLAPGVVVAVNC